MFNLFQFCPASPSSNAHYRVLYCLPWCHWCVLTAKRGWASCTACKVLSSFEWLYAVFVRECKTDSFWALNLCWSKK